MVLSEDDVKDIIKRKKKGETYDSLAIDYGVSMSTIVRAVNPEYRKKWAEHQVRRYRLLHPRINGRTIKVKPKEVFKKLKELLDSMFDRTMPVPDLEITVRPVRKKDGI